MMFSPMGVDLASLPSVGLKLLNELPDQPGIYFVVADSEVLYIGKAKSIRARWYTHNRLPDILQWDNVAVSWLVFDGTPELLNEIERACIAHFSPVLNVLHKVSARPESPDNSYVRYRLHCKLGAVMREKGVKEGELAEKAKVRRNTVRALARDANTRIDLIVVEKIAAALGVRPMDLFEETEEPRGPVELLGATT